MQENCFFFTIKIPVKDFFSIQVMYTLIKVKKKEKKLASHPCGGGSYDPGNLEFQTWHLT